MKDDVKEQLVRLSDAFDALELQLKLCKGKPWAAFKRASGYQGYQATALREQIVHAARSLSDGLYRVREEGR